MEGELTGESPDIGPGEGKKPRHCLCDVTGMMVGRGNYLQNVPTFQVCELLQISQNQCESEIGNCFLECGKANKINL